MKQESLILEGVDGTPGWRHQLIHIKATSGSPKINSSPAHLHFLLLLI